MKKTLLVTGIIGVLVFVLYALFYLSVISGAFLVFTYFAPNPPKPEITYGEFPFILTYEIDGEIKTIEDTLICEYDGIEWIADGSKERRWKYGFKSGIEEIILLDFSDREEIHELGYKILYLYFFCGSPEYYMGEEEGFRRHPADLDTVHYRYLNNEGEIGGSAYGIDETYEKYKVRIIDWKIADQIANRFMNFWQRLGIGM